MPKTDLYGAHVQVLHWSLGHQQQLENGSLTIPSSRSFFCAAISPRCDSIAAIGELPANAGSSYILHLFKLPELKLIKSEVFESNAREPAKVEFSADGEILLVHSARQLRSWRTNIDGSLGLEQVGIFERPEPFQGSLATSRHIFVASYTNESSYTTYDWVALDGAAETKTN
jgi:hypothetical protein